MCFTPGWINAGISTMNLTVEDRVDLEWLLRPEGYDGSVSARAQIVLWRAEGHSAPEIARMAHTTKPTVYKWITRYEQEGIDGLTDRVSTGRPPEISAEVRARILALTRQSPPEETGLSYWSSREMARYLSSVWESASRTTSWPRCGENTTAAASSGDVQALHRS
jgi:transposase